MSSLCLALAACGGSGAGAAVSGQSGGAGGGTAVGGAGGAAAGGAGGSTAAGGASASGGSSSSGAAGTGASAAAPAKASAPTVQHWNAPPPMDLQAGKSYSAVVHTNFGNFTVDLFAKQSPHTVNNFVFLARHGYYDGNRFFRIIRTFMVQTGDPTNTGRGGPGYHFADELPPPFPYAPGIVAMANAGPNTNGSQFFVCTGPAAAGLNQTPNYTEFGRVVSGMNVVERIAAIPVKPNPAMGGEMSLPTQDAHITSVQIVVK